MIRHFVYAAGGAVLVSAFSVSAWAEEAKSRFSADLVMEWQHEYNADSDDATIDQKHHSFAAVEFAPKMQMGDHLSLQGNFVFEEFDQAAALNANDDI